MGVIFEMSENVANNSAQNSEDNQEDLTAENRDALSGEFDGDIGRQKPYDTVDDPSRAGGDSDPRDSAQSANGAEAPPADEASRDETRRFSYAEKLAVERDEAVKQLAEVKDRLLRNQAEFENIRKRVERDKEESIQFANRQLIDDLLPIIDDLERAVGVAKSSGDHSNWSAMIEGIGLIEKRFIGLLERKWRLSRFESRDAAFDPQRHEAVTMETSSECEQATVIEEYQKGYLLHGKVLRPARVKVRMPE